MESRDGTDGVDDFIGRDFVFDACQCHIGAGRGIDGTDDIALDARDFHKSGDRIADESHQVGQCHGDIRTHLACSAAQMGQRGGGHCRCGADFSLATALGSRYG